jgi:hypothetical protein
MPARAARFETMDCVIVSASTPRRRSEEAWPLAHASLSAKAITPDAQNGRIQLSKSLREVAAALSVVAAAPTLLNVPEEVV